MMNLVEVIIRFQTHCVYETTCSLPIKRYKEGMHGEDKINMPWQVPTKVPCIMSAFFCLCKITLPNNL